MNPKFPLFIFAQIIFWTSSGFENQSESDTPYTGNLATEKLLTSDKSVVISQWISGDIPLLEVEVKYIGKSPKMPFDVSLTSYDWRDRDTDFYDITIKNLTDVPIYLEKTKNIFQFGENSDFYDENYILHRFGSSMIPPKSSITRENSWIWAKGEHNKMERFFWASIDLDSASTSSNLPGLIEETVGKYEFQFIVRTYYNR